MREQLDEILGFIGTSSLTDPEFDLIQLEDSDLDDLPLVFTEMAKVLDQRAEVSTYRARLRYYFMAQGAEIAEANATPPASTNILIGGGVCGD